MSSFLSNTVVIQVIKITKFIEVLTLGSYCSFIAGSLVTHIILVANLRVEICKKNKLGQCTYNTS